ncbi:MAG: hypothetical protein ACRCWJ_06275 [Casimicrobium sp.]
MKIQTETVEIAGQSVVVRELTMEELRQLLGLTPPKTVKPARLPVARSLVDWSVIESKPRRALARALNALWVRFVAPQTDDDRMALLGEAWASAIVDRALLINGISREYLETMSTVTEAMLLDARPSEIEALVAACKRLNAFFFDKLAPDFAATLSQALSALSQPSSAPATPTPGTTPIASSNPQ